MKNLITTVAFASIAGAVSTQAVEGLSLSGTFDYESEYIFRGIELGDHAIQTGVEAGYEIGEGSAYAGVWASDDLNNGQNGGSGFNSFDSEIDFYTGYAFPVSDELTFDVGFTYYFYPDSTLDRSREIYVGVSADVILSPAVYVYYDFDLEQIVIEGSAGYSIDLAEYAGVENTSLDLGGYFGFVSTDDTNGGQGGAGGENGYSYYGVSADIVYSISENVSSHIGVRYAGNNDNNNLGAEENFWFGTGIGFAY